MTHRISSLFAAVAILAICVAPFGAFAQAPEKAPAAGPGGPGEYQVLKSVSTAGIADYIKIDPESRRAYVGWGYRVSVFDIDAGKLIGEVAGVPRAHGVALIPGSDLAYASAGGSNEVVEFNIKTFQATRRIKAGNKPDAILYDPFSKKVFAMNGNDGTATVIDPAAPGKMPLTVPIFPDGGKLEFAVTDGAGHVYASVVNKSKVAVIDTKQMKVTGLWDTAPNRPRGMFYEPAQHRLYLGCAPQMMVIMDTRTGKVIGEAPIGKMVDSVGYDATLGVAVAACDEGVLSVIREEPAGKFTTVQTLRTAPFARTLAIDPKTHNIFLPCMIPPKHELGWYGLLVVGMAPKGPRELQLLKPISTRGTAEYVILDHESRRLYIAQGSRVAIFDVDQGKLAGEVSNVPWVHMVATVPGSNEAYATSGTLNEVVVFDTKTLNVLRKIECSKPEYMTYDPASKKIFVVNGKDEALCVIDPAAPGKEPVLVKIGAEIEQLIPDGAGNLYIGGEGSNEIIVFDTKAMKVTAKWSVAPNKMPRGLALDQKHHRLYAGCMKSNSAVVVDTRTGKMLASVPTGNGANGVVYDPKQNAALVANGLDGTISVVRETSPGKFATVQTLKTAGWARTLVMDPKTNLALVPCAIGGGTPDGLLIGNYGYLVVGTGLAESAKDTPPAKKAAAPEED